MSTDLALYDVAGTLANIDAGMSRLLALGGLALVFNFTFFGTAAYLGFKHKIYTMPLIGTLIFIPHDMLYLLMFDKWFNVYYHWFLQLFWGGLVITNILEGVFFYQVIKWGRQELMPQVSQPAYVAILLAALAATTVVWLGVKQMIADELWFFSFGWTVWFCTPFVIPLMLRRGSAAGQSMLMWGAYTGMVVCWWIAVWPLDPYFRSPYWVGLGVVTVLWALTIIIVMRRLPAAQSTVLP